MDVKVPYDLKDGRTVHINEVKEKGFACGCVCPGCGKCLMARLEGKKVRHFAHEKGEGFATCTESALHHAAKDILMETKQIMLPCVEVDFWGSTPPLRLAQSRTIQLNDVSLEEREGAIKPDLITIVKGVRLLIGSGRTTAQSYTRRKRKEVYESIRVKTLEFMDTEGYEADRAWRRAVKIWLLENRFITVSRGGKV